MPFLAASSQVDIVATGDSTLVIQNPGGFARVEYPVGTPIRVGGEASWEVDIPSGTCRLVTVTGGAFYEMTTDAKSAINLSPAEVAATQALMSGGGNGNGVAESVLSKYGKTALDITLSNVVPASATNMTWSRTAERQRFGNQTIKIQPTADTGCIMTFTNQGMVCDPDDLLYTIDVFVETMPLDYPVSVPILTLTLSASAGLGSNFDQWTFDNACLRQGWNTLKMWAGDDTSGGYRGSNLGLGVTRARTGTGFDFTQPAQYIGIRFSNMNGWTCHLDQFRRGAKSFPKVVIGFDATSISPTDNVFTEFVAPMLAAESVPSPYFTSTWVYNALYAGANSWNREVVLHNQWGWDAINHTWDHGATVEGRRNIVTLSRTSNLVTATWGAAHNITVGRQVRAKIYGATPSDLNGTVWLTATSPTQATYSATGVDGAGTGTIYFVSVLSDVLDAVSAENQRIIDHQIVDTSRLLRSSGMARGAHLLAWPNNSVPELTQTDSACRRAGVVLGRGGRCGYVNINELGIDNPLHFGAWAFESSASLHTTQTMLKRKIQGAIGRGECVFFFGHFILNEKAPEYAAHANANLDFPPGQGGNPAPPAAGVVNADGGWWYLGQLQQFVQWLKTQPLQLMSYRQFAEHVSATAREGV